MEGRSSGARAEVFRYAGLEVRAHTLVATYELDGRVFTETVTLEGLDLTTPGARAIAELWYLVAGLSYYKAGAAHVVDLAATPAGPAARALVGAALHDGLGEFAYRNGVHLDDVAFVGGAPARPGASDLDARRVLVPFGGGIDSVVSVERLAGDLDLALFVVSPGAGRFAALERTAAATGRAVVRATRTLDPHLLAAEPGQWRGHVPVTAMVTLLAALAAHATGRGGVAMSNEHSASAPNLRWRGRDVNHQWSKSLAAEELISAALAEVVGPDLVVASFLRDRSELWVAREFASLPAYHHVFRSCNRAFAQVPQRRAERWCGECDKCLFVHLVLAPFIARDELARVLGVEPLADPARTDQLAALVGLGRDHKPFECVGDPDESAVALAAMVADARWRDVAHLGELARRAAPERTLDELLEPQGPTRVPAHWLR